MKIMAAMVLGNVDCGNSFLYPLCSVCNSLFWSCLSGFPLLLQVHLVHEYPPFGANMWQTIATCDEALRLSGCKKAIRAQQPLKGGMACFGLFFFMPTGSLTVIAHVGPLAPLESK